MYADDLVLICPDEDHLRRALDRLNTWAINNNMTINERKSGIMFMNNPQAPTALSHITPIPIVTSYRYLGSHLTCDLTYKTHLAQTSRKVIFLLHKLTPIRLRANIKMNENLFRILVLPLYRLFLCNYTRLSPREK